MLWCHTIRSRCSSIHLCRQPPPRFRLRSKTKPMPLTGFFSRMPSKIVGVALREFMSSAFASASSHGSRSVPASSSANAAEASSSSAWCARCSAAISSSSACNRRARSASAISSATDISSAITLVGRSCRGYVFFLELRIEVLAFSWARSQTRSLGQKRGLLRVCACNRCMRLLNIKKERASMQSGQQCSSFYPKSATRAT